MQQLSLFLQAPEFPFERIPNRKERAIIETVFAGWLHIGKFLNDIIEMYPYKSLWNRSDRLNTLQAIGASASQPGFFYLIDTNSGCIYLEHQFSLFPSVDL